MPSLADLFGLNASRKINRSSAEAERRLAEARAQAEAALASGRGDINAGYDRAQGIYDSAAPGIRADLAAGYDAADPILRDAYLSAEDAVYGGAADANARLDPFVASGLGAQDLYDTALGLDGTAAADDFYADYADHDPFRAFRDEQANRQLAAQFNAQGQAGSGRFATAVSRASLERGTSDLNSYLDRLERAGARGAQYAGQQGQNSMAAGSQVGQIRAQGGTALANNQVNRGSALSQLGLNLADRSAGLATGRASALGGNASQIANLAYGHGQQLATNEINRSNAVNQANNVPVSNLINLMGTAARFYNPTPRAA